MSNFRPIDTKREEFRKYLERCGIMDALTKALVCLYEESEKPEDPLDYLRKQLGDERPDMTEYESVKAQLEVSSQTIKDLEEKVITLKERLEQYEPTNMEDEQPPTEQETEEEVAPEPEA